MCSAKYLLLPQVYLEMCHLSLSLDIFQVVMTSVYTPCENSGSSVPKALTLELNSHKFNVQTRQLGILLKMQSDSVGLGQGLSFCVSHKFPDVHDAPQLGQQGTRSILGHIVSQTCGPSTISSAHLVRISIFGFVFIFVYLCIPSWPCLKYQQIQENLIANFEIFSCFFPKSYLLKEKKQTKTSPWLFVNFKC